MFKIIKITTVFILLVSSLAFAEYYAVIITGGSPIIDSHGELAYNGDFGDPTRALDEFWNDTFVMWETLWQYGWNDENIYVLFFQGQDWSVSYPFGNPRYQGDQYAGYPYYIEHITDYPGTRASVESVFDQLSGIMTEDDFLYVYTFDHGGYETATGYAYLQLWYELQPWWEPFYDWELALMTNSLPYSQRVFFMQQCSSGGFADDLSNTSTVFMAACQLEEEAHQADDLVLYGCDPLECEYYPPEQIRYHHGEFNYHMLNALCLKTIYYCNSLAGPGGPDVDGNGLTSVEETKDWVFDWESQTETPVYTDMGEIGNTIFLNIPPYAPENLELENVNNQCHLTWDANSEFDLAYYNVYRAIQTGPGGPPPDPWPVIGQTEDNEFTDPDFAPIPGGPETAFYKVTAVDEAEQESEYSNIVGSHGYERPQSEGENIVTNIQQSLTNLRINPNPFNNYSVISYELNEASKVSLVLYDIQGREIESLVNGMQSCGIHEVMFNGIELSSGVYFVRLIINNEILTKKMLLVK